MHDEEKEFFYHAYHEYPFYHVFDRAHQQANFSSTFGIPKPLEESGFWQGGSSEF